MLKDAIKKLFNWFHCSNFMANEAKCHFFLSSYKPVTIKIKESAIEGFNSQKFWGVTGERKLSFHNQIPNLCHNTSQKLHALKRVASYLCFEKK